MNMLSTWSETSQFALSHTLTSHSLTWRHFFSRDVTMWNLHTLVVGWETVVVLGPTEEWLLVWVPRCAAPCWDGYEPDTCLTCWPLLKKGRVRGQGISLKREIKFPFPSAETTLRLYIKSYQKLLRQTFSSWGGLILIFLRTQNIGWGIGLPDKRPV